MKERKHEAPPRYDAAFKEGAIRLVSSKNWALCNACPGRASPTTMRWRKISSAVSGVNWYI